MTKTRTMSRLALVAAAFGLALLGVPGAERVVDGAAAAEPHAVQVLTARTAPRAGRVFLGVAVATLEAGARLYRSVTPTCTRGRIRVGPGRTLDVPVVVGRLPRNPDEGGSVRLVTTCSWRLPRGVESRTLTASVVVRYVMSTSTARLGRAARRWSGRSADDGARRAVFRASEQRKERACAGLGAGTWP